jgi:hypothetical protein
MLWLCTGLQAQQSFTAYDETYGHDPLLFNGKFYNYPIPSGTVGTPFFNGPDFVEGTATVRGLTYTNLLMKYDIVNQQIILQHKPISGGTQQVVLSETWLESFTLGDTKFEVFIPADTIREIYEVIGSGPVRVLYSWNKVLKFNTGYGSGNFIFSKAYKRSFLLMDGNLVKYKSNKNFISLLDPSKQGAVKKYLVRQHIQVKKASNQVMAELVNYCNTLQ